MYSCAASTSHCWSWRAGGRSEIKQCNGGDGGDGGADLTVPVQQVRVTARVLEEELHDARVAPPAGSHESRGPPGGVLDVDVNVPVSQQTLHYEHVALLGSDVQRGPPVFALDVDLDVLPLDELGHHHALGFVGGHTQRSLAVLIELVGVLAYSLQLVDHVGVPGEGEGESSEE